MEELGGEVVSDGGRRMDEGRNVAVGAGWLPKGQAG